LRLARRRFEREKAAMSNPISEPVVSGVISDDPDHVVTIDSTPEGVVTVTINRPDRRNAFHASTISALRDAFETLHGAEGVRVVFLRGAGNVFSAGADLEWMKAAVDWTEDDNRADAMGLAHMLKALADIPAPTVALVETAAMGGGAGLVAVCDMAVATAGTRFAFSEVKLGLIPATIGPYVVRAIGPRHAVALFATGRLFDAEHALRIGLITELVADTAALDKAKERITAEVMAAAPGAAAEAIQLVADITGKPINHELMEDTARRIARRRVDAEGQEGVRAFLDKRKPSWAG
jgi:methylglutaconyl-CoA hydratase